MINRKLQLSVISILVVFLVLFSSFGNLFGSVCKPKKTHAVVIEAAVAIATCAVGVIVYTQFDKNYGPLVREKANDITFKWIELAKADGNYEAFLDQIANAMPNYPLAVPFTPTALSALTINELFNAVVAVLSPDYPAIDTDCKYFLRKTGNIVAYGRKSTDVIPYGGWTTFSDGSGLAYPWKIFDKHSFNSYVSYIKLYDCTTNQLLHAYDYYMYSVTSNLTGFVGTDYYYSLPYYAGGKIPTDINDTNAAYYYFALLVGWFDQNEITYAGGTEQKVNNLTTYPMPATIPDDTMSAITNGDEDIPINNFANISYDNSTNIWNFDPDAYVLIDKSDTAAPTPVPTPTPTPGENTVVITGWSDLMLLVRQAVSSLSVIDNRLDNFFKYCYDKIESDLTSTDTMDNSLKYFYDNLSSDVTPTEDINYPSLTINSENLMKKFPFSLSTDLKKIVGVMSADPVAPVFALSLPLVGDFTVDLSIFDNIVSFVRTAILLIFILGLCWKSLQMFKE